jgi:hypothetical protein
MDRELASGPERSASAADLSFLKIFQKIFCNRLHFDQTLIKFVGHQTGPLNGSCSAFT